MEKIPHHRLFCCSAISFELLDLVLSDKSSISIYNSIYHTLIFLWIRSLTLIFFDIYHRPEFIEFFGLNKNLSNLSPKPVTHASLSNNNETKDSIGKATSDNTDDSSTSVLRCLIYFFLQSFSY